MNTITASFTQNPAGPFDLALQSRHFGGWPTFPHEPGSPVLAFPVEGTEHSAAVVLRQRPDGAVHGEIAGCPEELCERARLQALATLSLDVDGSGWPAVGGRDPLIGTLQARIGMLRPVLFHSPYEAAAAFVIGHRISIAQGRAIRRRMAAEHGRTIAVGGHEFSAFPAPAELIGLESVAGLPATKLERLRAVARAAQEGWLSRGTLLAMPIADALARLRELPGVGPFFAQGILFRGAGIVDGLTDDEVTPHAVALGNETLVGRGGGAAPGGRGGGALRELAERWRPYRMWAVVLLHTWARTEGVLPRSRVARPARAMRRAPAAASSASRPA